MKVGKENLRQLNVGKMEQSSHRTTITRVATAKRSRSFRASTKLMNKFRGNANVRTAVEKLDSSSNLVSWPVGSSTNVVDYADIISDKNSNDRTIEDSKEINDFRSIVREVKNKLSLTDRPRRKNRTTENVPTIDVDDRNSNNRHDYWNSIDVHSYENPTFSLDGSIDRSISECMYDATDAESQNIPVYRDDCRRSRVETNYEIDGRNRVSCRDDETLIQRRSTIDHDRPNSYRNEINEFDNLITEERQNYSRRNYGTTDYLSWIINRRTNFRSFDKNGRTNDGRVIVGTTDDMVDGVVAAAADAAAAAAAKSKSHSYQGMEFLEGFGKKKQQPGNNQANNLAANINPLTAQPSLNIHVHALFVATEHGNLEKVRTILESTDVDVNSVNSDGLSTLDVAVLSNNRPLAKMLIAYGAREGNRFASPESLDNHLGSLLSTAELRARELGGTEAGPCSSSRGAYSTLHNGQQQQQQTGCGDVDVEDKQQLATWERRIRALRKMLLGFDQSRPPDTTFNAVVDVIGTNSIVLKFQESDVHDCSPICTKFNVQWTTNEDFTSLRGERILLDMKQRECRIDGLVHGQRYYLRAAGGNIKGWSRFINSTPACVIPSGWRDVEGKTPRYNNGRHDKLETIFSAIARSEYNKESSSIVQRRNNKKKTTTIKQLFTATSKFQKSLRRGIFLACLFYNEDKVLVTNEDFLPVIEVDETYSPSSVYNDFHWFMKVGCTWTDVKSLKHDMEKSGQSISSNHLRLKLLQAASQMQAALCYNDLGQIYYKLMRDVNGTMVISMVNYVKTTKSISILNGRWLALNKVMKKMGNTETSNNNNNNVADILMSSIQSQMTYHQSCSVKLTRGLYLGYLKMQSSVDLVRVFVPSKAPYVLPHCKIRDNSHVSAEEWRYLKRVMRSEPSIVALDKKENSSNPTKCVEPTEQEKLFVDLVSATCRRLFSYMEINSEVSHDHRIYETEVIELGNQVSLIVIVPPAETACSVPGTRDILLRRSDLLVLPIQAFEMINMSGYQKKMFNLYSRVSCILELDTAQAQHNHREAFTTSEIESTRDKLEKLQDLQCRVNAIWKEARWLIDLINFARDRLGNSSTIKNLLTMEPTKNMSNGNNSLKRSSVQRPLRDPKLVKSSPGRGSWPGPPNLPNLTNLTDSALSNELSKSEQQLPNNGANGNYSRKSSITDFRTDDGRANDINATTRNNGILAMSRSEDSLLLTKYKHSPRNRSVTSLTSVPSFVATVNSSTNVKSSVVYSNCHGNHGSVSNGSTNNWPGVGLNGKHSSNPKDGDYGSVKNFGKSMEKCKSGKPTASVAAVAAPSADGQTIDKNKDDSALMPAPLPGILQVYAAYRTGLALGTSLKLHVTPRTTAREVVDLVVKQLNMAVVLKGQEGPIYTADELPNFCLVAVIGARERCLRDDFKPLQLQNPWKKGRLYVRQKHDVLAALEHSTKQIAYV